MDLGFPEGLAPRRRAVRESVRRQCPPAEARACHREARPPVGACGSWDRRLATRGGGTWELQRNIIARAAGL